MLKYWTVMVNILILCILLSGYRHVNWRLCRLLLGKILGHVWLERVEFGMRMERRRVISIRFWLHIKGKYFNFSKSNPHYLPVSKLYSDFNFDQESNVEYSQFKFYSSPFGVLFRTKCTPKLVDEVFLQTH